MRRTRAIGVVGLVLLGVSGCAGTHHHHHHMTSKPVGMPAGPPAVPGSPCGCEAHVHAAPDAPHALVAPPGVARVRTTTVVATTTTRPVSSSSSLPPSSRPVAVPSPPPSSRPVAVPAPGVAVRYLPMFDEPGTIVRSAWDSAPPDLLGVRTAMPSDGSPLSDLPPAPGDLDLIPPGPLPSSRAFPSSGPVPVPAPSAPGSPPGMPPAWNPDPPVPDKTIPARWGQIPPPGEVVPTSTEVPALAPAAATETGPSASQPGRTIGLEYLHPGPGAGSRSGSLAGRPRWSPNPGALPPRDSSGPSSWVSQLAFSATAPPAPPAPRVSPTPREAVHREVVPAGRDSVVSRFVRRVRGAGRAFIDPDAVRLESGRPPAFGTDVQQASAVRVGDAATR